MVHKQLKHNDERVKDDRKRNNEWVNRRACKFVIKFAKWIVRTQRCGHKYEKLLRNERWRFIGQKLIFMESSLFAFIVQEWCFTSSWILKLSHTYFRLSWSCLDKESFYNLIASLKIVWINVCDRQVL